ncbi:MAG: dephospho-CoA kinase [Dialister micraerophilus]|uniref:dephospho-CoA kinase n=1 Tax=Dialister micraerophilus TaxID=309120 RepID=UPI0023F4728E|nr:dephospho-CoA kinase [Dialister micraerophilus]MDU5300931.1 dephospho-CoA kinase [Dialister micraerophilus]
MNMYLIGLTGGMGSGKSTVADCLRSNGTPVIDADVIAHKIMNEESTLDKIHEIFGKNVFDKDGSLNKVKFSSVLFTNTVKRKKLNEFVHPKVWTEMMDETEKYVTEGSKVIFLDVPLLIESGWHTRVNETWLVKADYNERIERLSLRTNLSTEEIKKRIEIQMPESEKEEYADKIINNDGTIEETGKQVIEELQKIIEKTEKR